eukprot:PhM_4_TR13935/c0_g2_i9/m.43640
MGSCCCKSSAAADEDLSPRADQQQQQQQTEEGPRRSSGSSSHHTLPPTLFPLNSSGTIDATNRPCRLVSAFSDSNATTHVTDLDASGTHSPNNPAPVDCWEEIVPMLVDITSPTAGLRTATSMALHRDQWVGWRLEFPTSWSVTRNVSNDRRTVDTVFESRPLGGGGARRAIRLHVEVQQQHGRVAFPALVDGVYNLPGMRSIDIREGLKCETVRYSLVNNDNTLITFGRRRMASRQQCFFRIDVCLILGSEVLHAAMDARERLINTDDNDDDDQGKDNNVPEKEPEELLVLKEGLRLLQGFNVSS